MLNNYVELECTIYALRNTYIKRPIHVIIIIIIITFQLIGELS